MGNLNCLELSVQDENSNTTKKYVAGCLPTLMSAGSQQPKVVARVTTLETHSHYELTDKQLLYHCKTKMYHR